MHVRPGPPVSFGLIQRGRKFGNDLAISVMT